MITKRINELSDSQALKYFSEFLEDLQERIHKSEALATELAASKNQCRCAEADLDRANITIRRLTEDKTNLIKEIEQIERIEQIDTYDVDMDTFQLKEENTLLRNALADAILGNPIRGITLGAA